MKPSKSGAATVVDFQKAQDELRATIRQGMLAEATRLLTEEGPSALTVRRVAEAVNCSTTLLYSLFGGKDGLSNELYLEGLALLAAHFDAAAASTTKKRDPLARIRLHAQAYHRFAKENPSYYMVLFGDAIAGFVPKAEARMQAWEALARLIEAFDAAMQAGALPPSDPKAAARLLWAAMHGTVSLELKGYYLKTERADELFDAGVDAVLLALAAGADNATNATKAAKKK